MKEIKDRKKSASILLRFISRIFRLLLQIIILIIIRLEDENIKLYNVT